MGASSWVDLEVEKIIRETEAAFLLRLGSGEEIWIPKSQIADADDYEQGDEDLTISITEWIAGQKDIG